MSKTCRVCYAAEFCFALLCFCFALSSASTNRSELSRFESSSRYKIPVSQEKKNGRWAMNSSHNTTRIMGSIIHNDVSEFSTLQSIVDEKPYSIPPRLDLADAYFAAGYPDLAVGEEYIALLLVDECEGLGGEYEEQASDAANEDYLHGDGADVEQREEKMKIVMVDARLDM